MIVSITQPTPLLTCHNCMAEEATVQLRLDNKKTQLLLCPPCWGKLAYLVEYWPGAGSLRSP